MVRSHGDLYPPWHSVDHPVAAGSDPAFRGAGAVLSGAQKLGDEAKNLPAGVSGPMMNDEFADVTFALFALKARESRRGSWCVTLKPCASSCCMYPG